MQSLLISIIASTIVAIIYALVLGQREDKLRAYLKTLTGGWLRRSYVRALIQAVQGEAVVAQSAHFATIILLLFLGAGFVVYASASSLQREWSSVEKDLGRLLTKMGKQPTPEERDRRLAEELHEMLEKRKLVNASMRWQLPLMKIISVILIGVYLVGSFFWRPYVFLRTRFAQEIARFSLRIQGLASQEELAKLSAAEVAVKSQARLKAYVEIMKQVATRHGMPELTKTFELWGD